MRPVLAVLLSACAAHRTGDAVRNIEFEGNTRRGFGGLVEPQTDRTLRNALTQTEGNWQSFLAPGVVEPAWLDRTSLDADAERIEVWYANHGFFDARFLGWEVRHRTVREGRRVRPVDVVGHIDQGLPTRISEVRVTSPLRGPIQNRINELVAVSEGEIFDTETYRSTLGAIRGFLHARSYAYAEVVGRVDVRADERVAVVTIDVRPGLVCRFGEVTLKGRRPVDDALLQPLITIEPGKGYSPSKMAKTRTGLYGLRVFSIVNVVPDLSDPSNPVVPVTIELRAADTHEVKIGPELVLEPGLQTLGVGGVYSDFNVGRRLWRWENELSLGVATLATSLVELGSVDARSGIAPILRTTSTFTMPRIARYWTLRNELGMELGAEPGYRYLAPEYSPSVTWEKNPFLTPTLGYRIKAIDYFTETYRTDVTEDTSTWVTPFGDDHRDPAILSLLEQRVTWDSRNDPLQPNAGWYWNVGLAEAGLGGNFNFVRAQGDIRRYLSWLELFPHGVEDFVLAGRLGGGVILTYGPEERAKVPRPERFFVGGGTTVRGWPADRLGPRDETGDPETWREIGDEVPPIYLIGGDDKDLRQVARGRDPIGGELMFLGNFELRKRLYNDLWGAAFLDGGRVWRYPDDFLLSGLMWSVGGGVRYMTAIGPVRLDAAYVLNRSSLRDTRSELYGLRGWAIHFGLSEAF